MQPTEPEISVKVFISCAHADRELRKKLEEHLGSLKNSGKITVWQDQEIPPGANWDDQIRTRLNEAHLILLLVSSSFIDSYYCWNKEVLPALERHKTGDARVIPIILRPVAWQDVPLGQLQVLPTGAKPVTQWDDQDAAFEDVVRGIRKVVEDLRITLREDTQKSEKIKEIIHGFEANIHPTVNSINKDLIQVVLSDGVFITAPSHLGSALLEVTAQMRKVVEDLNTSKKEMVELPLSPFDRAVTSTKDGVFIRKEEGIAKNGIGSKNGEVLVHNGGNITCPPFPDKDLDDTKPLLSSGNVSLLIQLSKKARNWLARLDYLCYIILISSTCISALFVLSWGVIWLVFASPLVLTKRVSFIGEVFYWVVSVMLIVTLIAAYVKVTNLTFLSLFSVLKRWSLISRSPDGASSYFQITSWDWIWRHQATSPAGTEATVDQRTKACVDEVHGQLGSRTYDETLSRLVDEHYILDQLLRVLSPLYQQLGTQSPLRALQSLLGEGRVFRVDQQFNERWKTSLQDVENLLSDAASESDQPMTYLRNLLTAKRDFKGSYAKRGEWKDCRKMPLSELRRRKTTEAAIERFRRAVDAIMAYNDAAPAPEMRWFINPAVIVDLVGGRPSDVKEYLASRQAEIDAHHQKYDQKLTPIYNRRPIPITERVKVPELPGGEPETETSEAAAEE